MSILKIHKVTALPQTLEANSIYLVAPPSKPQYIEMYVTGTSASTVKRILNDEDVQAMINATLQGFNNIRVVANITERNNLSPSSAMFVLVLDATGDPTVSSGSASYVWNPSGNQWIKIAEYESMDLVLQWSSIQGRPNSTPEDIDDAVAKKHMHTNMTQLNKVGEDAQGNLMYGGAYPKIAWDTTNW